MNQRVIHRVTLNKVGQTLGGPSLLEQISLPCLRTLISCIITVRIHCAEMLVSSLWWKSGEMEEQSVVHTKRVVMGTAVPMQRTGERSRVLGRRQRVA